MTLETPAPVAKPHKVYIVQFKRKYDPKFPDRVLSIYKVGYTSHTDVLDRFKVREDDPAAIMRHFDYIKVLASEWCANIEEAVALESHIIQTIAQKTSSERFHNFWEELQLNGITETRKWNYTETSYVFQILKEWKQNKKLLGINELIDVKSKY